MERKPTAEEPPCPLCGYPCGGAAEDCDFCHGEARLLASRQPIVPKRRFFLTDFTEGFLSPFRAALQLMTRKEYVSKLFWPVLANLVAVSVLFGLGFWFFWSTFESWLDVSWLQWAKGWVGGTLAFILTSVTLFLLAPTLIELVTSPFLDPLAATTEGMVTGRKPKPLERGFVADLSYGARNAAKILVIQILILIPALLLSMIPLLFFLPLLAAAYLNALIWFEIPVMRRGYEMSYRRFVVRRNWARALGFGLGFQLGLFVPFFNFLFLTPAAAVAVSQLYFRFEKTVPTKP